MKLKFIYAAIFLLIVANVNSQTISQVDQDYLDSLPEDVRKDILEEMSNKEGDDKRILRVPSSSISSLETVQRWEKFLENEGIEKSERYGMQMFRSMQSSFMPINEPNLSPEYILDYGDTIEIQIVGSKDMIINEEVRRDGALLIPEVGKIYVGGKSLSDSSQIIKNKISDTFIGTNVYVTLTSLRDIQVLITGHSKFPGLYTLSGNSNILNALNVSGGISDEGSFRLIDIKRNGEIIKTIDLYQPLIFGNINFHETLRSGDSIYIHPAQKLIRAGNGFKNKGIFELKENESYKDFLKFTGSLSRNVKTSNISINSIKDGKYESNNINVNDLENITPKNNDSLYAIEESYGTIKISGEVMQPGNYEISSDETILSVIKRAGGYKESAFPFGGILFREQAKKIEQQNNDRLYYQFVKYIATSISKGTGGQVGTSLPTVLDELKNVEVLGRVQAEFDLVKLKDNPNNDIFLSDKDEIVIPKYQPLVFVYGEVRNPGGIRYQPNLITKDYISLAGGYNDYSNKETIIVVDPSGSAKIYTDKKILFNSNNNIDVYPGSLVYIGRDIDKVQGLDFTAASASIFSSLALALASLNSIN